jgi:hypothetical protein
MSAMGDEIEVLGISVEVNMQSAPSPFACTLALDE